MFADQIRRVNAQVDEVHANLDTSEYLLRGIESVFGAVGNAFRRKPGASAAAAVEASLQAYVTAAGCDQLTAYEVVGNWIQRRRRSSLLCQSANLVIKNLRLSG